MVIEFWLEYGQWGQLTRRLSGASWRATMVADCQRYAGSDDSPWVAIALAIERWSMAHVREPPVGSMTLAPRVKHRYRKIMRGVGRVA